MRKILLLFAMLLIPVFPARAEIKYEDVLEMGQRFEPRALEYMKREGAEIIPTQDGRSFWVWWAPEGFDPKEDTVFVSLHGHQGWATKGFQVWHPRLKGRKLAFLGIQWWYGRSAEWNGYAKPRDIYPWIQEALAAKGIPPGHVIFEGFSMGGANSYAVAYFDKLQTTPYFAVIISNAGAMEADFPPNRPLLEQIGKSTPLAGAHWILYCSENDEQREKACEKMQWTYEQLKTLGATVEQFTRDPVGPHGGFMVPNISGPALDLAQKIVRESKRGQTLLASKASDPF